MRMRTVCRLASAVSARSVQPGCNRGVGMATGTVSERWMLISLSIARATGDMPRAPDAERPCRTERGFFQRGRCKRCRLPGGIVHYDFPDCFRAWRAESRLS